MENRFFLVLPLLVLLSSAVEAQPEIVPVDTLTWEDYSDLYGPKQELVRYWVARGVNNYWLINDSGYNFWFSVGQEETEKMKLFLPPGQTMVLKKSFVLFVIIDGVHYQMLRVGPFPREGQK